MLRREAVGIELGLRPDSSGEGVKESDYSEIYFIEKAEGNFKIKFYNRM